MPKLTNLLSDRQLKNWMIKGDTVAKSDGDGLTFTLSNAGTASWVLRYRLNGRRKEVTLGNYPDISLSNAREKARALRAAVDASEDVAVQKQTARSRAIAAWSIRDLVNDYREKILRLDSFSKITIQYRTLNRPGFCRQSRASYFLSNRSPYEQSTLPRRIQDRGGQTNP